jgi:hypothetical protein
MAGMRIRREPIQLQVPALESITTQLFCEEFHD